MRSAPPVLVPVGRFVWGPRVALGLALGTLGLGLGWLWQQGADAQAHGLMLLAWLALSAASAGWGRREFLPAGQLSWDGRAWWFQESHASDPAPVALRLVWDGQLALAVHVQTATRGGPRGFAWLRAADLPHSWHGLRCAVHATDTL